MIQLVDNNHIYQIEIDALDIKQIKKREIENMLTEFTERERERFGGRRRPPHGGAVRKKK